MSCCPVALRPVAGLICAIALLAEGSSRAASIDDLPPAVVPAGDWPWWRGPTFDNKSPEPNPPLHWGTGSNVVWKTPIPGRGHATPAVWGQRIFIATADEELQVQRVLCYERGRGTLQWEAEICRGGFLAKHDKNSHASATPACDGERVFFASLFDQALFVTALAAADGRRIWQRKVGQFIPSNGYGSSPLLYKSAVIVASDTPGEACLMALHRASGEVLWRVDRPKLDNFCTPTLARTSGRWQLLLSGSRMLAGYDPDTGQRRWFVDSPTEVTACTMAVDGRLAVGGGNVPVREFLCVRTDGTGDVTSSHLLWRSRQNVTYVPSPVLHEGLLYMINDTGIAHCIEAQTGDLLWKERLRGEFSASPLLAAGRLFAPNEKGETFILRIGKRYELEATNSIEEPILASAIISQGQLFLRSTRHLWCIGR